MFNRRRSILLGSLGLLLAGSAGAQEKSSPRALTLGIMPYLNTRALLATYQPIAKALEQDLKQPIQLLTAPDFDTFVKRVFNGDYDIALLAPHYARLAVKDYGYSLLLMHKQPIRSVLVTARNNPLNSLADLRNQSISIVERSALVAIGGSMALAEEGLKENVDYRFVETVSHSSALHSAISGKTRAAIVSASTLLLTAPELRDEAVVFTEISRIPGMFYLAHNRLPPARQAAIKNALLTFEKTGDGVAFFEKTQHGGFREPSKAEIELLDRMLPETRRLLSNILP